MRFAEKAIDEVLPAFEDASTHWKSKVRINELQLHFECTIAL